MQYKTKVWTWKRVTWFRFQLRLIFSESFPFMWVIFLRLIVPEQEPGPAMVLRVDHMLLTCCSTISFVSKGKFTSFSLWFADKFDTDTDDWKPNFESGVMSRCSRCKESLHSSFVFCTVMILLLLAEFNLHFFKLRCCSWRNLWTVLQNAEVSRGTR